MTEGTVDTVRALCHDLRQPLAAIMLLSSAVGPRQRELEHIYVQARWLADLVEAVLSDASTDRFEEVDVASVVRGCVERALPTSPAQCHFHSQERPVSVTQRVALGRAVCALIDNAVRAAGPAGHVEVSVAPVGDEIVVVVADDGPGLGQVESCHSLGLAIARALCCSSGGRLTISPGPIRGVEARIMVPLAHSAPLAKAPQPDAVAS